MRRWVAPALAVLWAAAGAGEAMAQEESWHPAGRFDLGVYAGGTTSSPWFVARPDGAGERHRIAYAPVFGAEATLWAAPRLGLRLHGAYSPSDLPDRDEDVVPNSSFTANHWLFDLDLVFRPWAARTDLRAWLASTYLFLGGGGFTTDVAGDSPARCAPDAGFPASGVCVPTAPALGTTGMGVAGAGMDLYPMTSSIVLFGEAAVHVYDSPAHVSGAAAEDRLAFTGRVAGGVKLRLGRAAPLPLLPPAVPPPPDTGPATPGVVAAEVRDLPVCVVDGGALRVVVARHDVTRGDTLVDGRPLAEAFPEAAAAAERPWFGAGEPVVFGGRTYGRFGLPRLLAPGEVVRAGEFGGAGVFVEAGASGAPEVVYVPAGRGCEMQPYQRLETLRGVRG